MCNKSISLTDTVHFDACTLNLHDVHTCTCMYRIPCVRCLTVGAILLYMHTKETHVHSFDLLKDEHGLCSEGELRREFATKPLLHHHPRLKGFVRRRHHSDGDVPRPLVIGTHSVKKIVDAILQESG